MSTNDIIIIDDSDLPELHYLSVTVKNQKTEDTNESSNVVHTGPAAFQQLVVAEVHCSNTGKCECKNTVLEPKLEDVSESNQQAEVKVETRQHTIETEIRDVTRGNQADELRVHIPVMKGSLLMQNAMIYKPRIRDPSKETVMITNQVDKSNLGTPVPEDEQLPGFYYCNKCPKKFSDIGYF